MTLKKLLKIIERAYPDISFLGASDPFISFIIEEITKTYDPRSGTLLQLSRASRVLRTIRKDTLIVEQKLNEEMAYQKGRTLAKQLTKKAKT